ncbi:MAG TPA: AAA family ATPase [Pseudonocardiaceae bacterium]|nr:AAA family ATPase [Pseudonocardiaceae bacterium]
MVPVLWLCGPPGVGKSTLAYRIHARLRAAGVASAYVDIDQLGMCYPETDSDPDRYRLKERNLGLVVRNFAAHGASCVVVSGIVDPAYRVELPDTALTLCRLRVERDELVRRFLGRSPDEKPAVAGVLADADDMDASSLADRCVDTTGLTEAESLARVETATAGWHTAGSGAPPSPVVEPADGPVLWVGGAPGVGTSMVGYAIYLRTMRSGRTMGYLDLRQVGGFGPEVDHRPRAANVVAIWRSYRDRGADGLVIAGELGDVDRYRAVLPGLAVCRLHASRADLEARIRPRGARRPWPQPGDPYLGRSARELTRVVERALAADGSGVRVDSSGLTVDQTADAVLATGLWPLLDATHQLP